jgi:hypothetical protein
MENISPELVVNTPVPAPEPETVRVRVPSEAQINVYVKIIMSQTDMTEDDVLASLTLNEYNVMKVIRSYMSNNMSVSTSEKTVFTQGDAPASTNQLRFNEIRGFMDKAAENFRRSQEMNKIYQQVMERKKAQAIAAANSNSNSNSKLEPCLESPQSTDSNISKL